MTVEDFTLPANPYNAEQKREGPNARHDPVLGDR